MPEFSFGFNIFLTEVIISSIFSSMPETLSSFSLYSVGKAHL